VELVEMVFMPLVVDLVGNIIAITLASADQLMVDL
jgi:hypothetical protein